MDLPKAIATVIYYLRCGWRGFTLLFYPHSCFRCGFPLDDREEVLCEYCMTFLPITEHGHMRDNGVEHLFADIPKFVRGGAFCYYKPKSFFRRMIHALKYSNVPNIGLYLGRLAGDEYHSMGFFQGIDVIVPVPLHPKRLYKRGYNQAEIIAQGISEATGIPMDTTHLMRIVNNVSQTSLSMEDRQNNTDDIFAVQNSNDWRNKHILLVDDIITTGATLHACIKKITPIHGTHISVLTMGMAVQE